MVASTALKREGPAGDRIARAGFLIVLLFFGCTARLEPPGSTQGRALRIREVVDEGDPQRRASTRLILTGLAAANPQHALSQYERAIKTDASNPYAFLALAAYEIQWGDVERGEQALDQAALLFRSEPLNSPRVAPHLDGLRGRAALRTSGVSGGSANAMKLLDQARRAAPDVWSDGWLNPEELR